MTYNKDSLTIGETNERAKKVTLWLRVIRPRTSWSSKPLFREKYTLEPDAVAVYDVIKGAESMGMHKIVQQGLAWFMEYEPKAYMVLLDWQTISS